MTPCDTPFSNTAYISQHLNLGIYADVHITDGLTSVSIMILRDPFKLYIETSCMYHTHTSNTNTVHLPPFVHIANYHLIVHV